VLEKSLEKLGLSPSEIKIYLYLLKKDSSYPNKISAQTGINRTNVYEALNRLLSKGIISYIVRNKIKWFEAKSLDYLKIFVAEKHKEFEKNKSNLFSEINKLEKNTPKEKQSLEASIFVGKTGLKSIFEEILETEKPIAILAAELQLRKFFGAYFFQWHNRRVKKKIKHRAIFAKKVKKDLVIFKLMKVKFVDNEYVNPSTTIIYGNNVVLIHWSSNPFAIKIPNKETAKSHLNYFNLIWNSK